ncbi:MAG TPA: large conductance mechanosensitive channel protein MscL [Pseudonocardiaceae bacterium]|jgi:large conductance mechanosensitive channel|nr:large conductance mechanosensitive channel protein MscL [Pseudonocardiaceae bacterium]
MLKGFREFVFRGNIFELAVAVVIGTAFTAVVTSVVTNLINPVIAAVGGHNINGLSITLVSGNSKTVMHFDTVITAVINFVIIAAVVYFAFVMPMQKIIEMRRRNQPAAEPELPEPTDVEVLLEIRDLLQADVARDRQAR